MSYQVIAKMTMDTVVWASGLLNPIHIMVVQLLETMLIHGVLMYGEMGIGDTVIYAPEVILNNVEINVFNNEKHITIMIF